VLVYEAPLIRNITSRVEPLTVVSGSDIRTVLQLDRASFIDFALLLGTDFSQRIKNVGPQRALKFIREHGSIERVIERERKYSPRGSEKAYLEQVEIARLVFQTLPPVPDVRLLQAKESDDELVSTILQRHGLHRAVTYNWDHTSALDGNYFQDNPSAF
jgi:flap endonuclease-1